MRIFVITILAVSVVGCSMSLSDNEKTKVGMPNPASVYCIDKGGKLVKVTNEKGDSFDCILPDGERIDEWALYRRDHQ